MYNKVLLEFVFVGAFLISFVGFVVAGLLNFLLLCSEDLTRKEQNKFYAIVIPSEAAFIIISFLCMFWSTFGI